MSQTDNATQQAKIAPGFKRGTCQARHRRFMGQGGDALKWQTLRFALCTSKRTLSALFGHILGTLHTKSMLFYMDTTNFFASQAEGRVRIPLHAPIKSRGWSR
jgi:hypothetical protein